jgi:hypothetical protein
MLDDTFRALDLTLNLICPQVSTWLIFDMYHPFGRKKKANSKSYYATIVA